MYWLSFCLPFEISIYHIHIILFFFSSKTIGIQIIVHFKDNYIAMQMKSRFYFKIYMVYKFRKVNKVDSNSNWLLSKTLNTLAFFIDKSIWFICSYMIIQSCYVDLSGQWQCSLSKEGSSIGSNSMCPLLLLWSPVTSCCQVYWHFSFLVLTS